MTTKSAIVASLLLSLQMISTVFAQSLVTTMTLARDQLALVKTSQGITTKLSFPERIKEIICGDLYDPAGGRGNFVVQRSDNDLFLKPVAATGVSNLFVKTGEAGEYTYSFELLVVPVSQSYRIVNIVNGHGNNKGLRNASLTSLPPTIARVDWMAGLFSDAPAMLALGDLPRTTAPPPPAPKGEQVSGGKKLATNTTSDPPMMNTGQVVLDSVPIRREKPLYPDSARIAGVTGEVVVEVIVNEGGKVISATALSGPMLLRQAAVNAARGWKFRPLSTQPDGTPARAVSTIIFAFKSNDPGRDSESASRLSDVRKPKP